MRFDSPPPLWWTAIVVMRPGPIVCAILTLALVSFTLPARAPALDGPVVLITDGMNASMTRNLRQRVSRQLGVPVIGLADPRAEGVRYHLSVAMPTASQAVFYWQDGRGHPVRAERQTNRARLASVTARLIRAASWQEDSEPLEAPAERDPAGAALVRAANGTLLALDVHEDAPTPAERTDAMADSNRPDGILLATAEDYVLDDAARGVEVASELRVENGTVLALESVMQAGPNQRPIRERARPVRFQGTIIADVQDRQ
ncbi:MAG: hypothetical protein AAGF12_30570 [Myxococcota bacterium]